MITNFAYKQLIKNTKFNAHLNQKNENDESKESEIEYLNQIFFVFTNLFQEQKFNEFLENLNRLKSFIFQYPSQFESFVLSSSSTLQTFFHQCSCFLLKIADDDKEKIISFFQDLIQNKAFSSSFSDFCGDLMLVEFYNKISENVNNCILNILIYMKLSSKFPIHIFREYFKKNTNDLRFIALFINSMDNAESIGVLFQEFVLFPTPQRQDGDVFQLFCKVIISFFQHSLDESLFIKSNYYDVICASFQSSYTDQAIAYFLQITARLKSHVEVLSKIQPNLLFVLLKCKKSKSIIVPVLILIDSLMSMQQTMTSFDFIQHYVDKSVIMILLKNLNDETFVIRVKTLYLLNSIIVKSEYTILQFLFQNDAIFSEFNSNDFAEFISKVIFDLFDSDDVIITLALDLAYHIITYVQKPANQSNLSRLLFIWRAMGIDDIIQQFTLSEGKFTEDAQKIYIKIAKCNNIVED